MTLQSLIRSSLRARLILSFAVAILVPALITTIVGVQTIKKHVYGQAQSKINSDLESAKEIYANALDRLKDTLRIHATRMVLYRALSEGDRADLGPELERIRAEEGLDVLTLVDAQGTVVFRAANPELSGDDVRADPTVQEVLARRSPVASTEVIGEEELRRASEALAMQAAMDLAPTPHARPTDQKRLTAGLMLKGGAPVFTPSKRFLGALVGGNLLNRNYTLVDKVRTVVFKDALYRGRETGTVTIFQGDVRVSTNVKGADGARAIATRVSAEVAEAVLDRGETWRGRAFVVNDWYLSAYAPLKNLEDRTVGMLYVGLLEKPYRDGLHRSLALFLGIAALGVVLLIIVATRVAQKIARPVAAMARAADEVATGDYAQRVPVRGTDEIAHLAHAFNRMVAELQDTHQALKGWTETLEQKVEQRTAELKAMQAQLFQTEKLAAVGKLAAGVAHEINNPLTGILTNASLMLEDLPADDPRRPDLQTIVDETLRCRKIVKGLLDFARQTPPQKTATSLNRVVEDVLALVRNQASFRNIAITTALDPALPTLMTDQDQMRQVVLNIVLNASEAMAQGGALHIGSRRDPARGRIEVAFRDTGPGIPDDIKDKLFEPFFTTKATGTGLGLAIAYGILERHGGEIRVESRVGHGTTITLSLPEGPV